MSYEQTFDDNDFDAPEALSPDANADEQQHAGTNGNHSSASGHAAAAGSDGYGQPAASWELRHHRDQDTAAAAGTGSGTAGAHGAGNGSAADAAGNGRGASYKTEPGTSSSRPPAASGSGSAGSKDIQLFAGSLTNATTDAMLRDYFKTFGTIIDCRVGRTRDGRSRGFAFLSVADESTSAAILGQAHIIDGKQVCLRRALSSEEEAKTGRIFIGGLPPEATEEDVIKACSEYGAVHSADIIRDQETKESRKFGYVRFADMESVKTALRATGGNITVCGRKVRIDIADPSSKAVTGRPTRASSYSAQPDPRDRGADRFIDRDRDYRDRGRSDRFDRYDRYDRYDRPDRMAERSRFSPIDRSGRGDRYRERSRERDRYDPRDDRRWGGPDPRDDRRYDMRRMDDRDYDRRPDDRYRREGSASGRRDLSPFGSMPPYGHYPYAHPMGMPMYGEGGGSSSGAPAPFWRPDMTQEQMQKAFMSFPMMQQNPASGSSQDRAGGGDDGWDASYDRGRRFDRDDRRGGSTGGATGSADAAGASGGAGRGDYEQDRREWAARRDAPGSRRRSASPPRY